MAITNFIPTIWSENLYRSLDRQYIGVANCSRDYEGEIKNLGSSVKICGVGSINISDYTKNSDMLAPQTLNDTVKELVIDQAKYFNFQIDDIDKAQSTPKLMEAAMRVAAEGLASTADAFVFDYISQNALHYTDHGMPTASNILDVIINARQKLYEFNVSDQQEIVLEVPPQVATMILKSKITLSSDNNAALENGYLGSFAGCKIFVSNNMPPENSDFPENLYCLMRTKRAVAFAEQLSEIIAYRPEKRFADAVKGLHLYGAAIVYPDELLKIRLLND